MLNQVSHHLRHHLYFYGISEQLKRQQYPKALQNIDNMEAIFSIAYRVLQLCHLHIIPPTDSMDSKNDLI